jgi:predicted dehydrogenase
MAHGIGILGLGVMGERMLRNLREHPAFTVVAAWDPAEAALDKLGRLATQARAAADAAALVADPAVQCVYIAAPPSHHLAHAHLAFDHGKAVFCEKPLATDLAAARAAVERVERDRLTAAINFPYAAAPAVRAVASGLKSGEIGPIERVEIEVAFQRWPRAWQESAAWLALRREGGFVREVLSHFIFVTQRLLGPLRLHGAQIDYPGDGRSAETAIAARLDAGTVPVMLSGRVGGDVPDWNRWRLCGRNGAFELHDWYSLRRRIDGSWLDIDFGEGASDRERSYRAQLDALDAMLTGRPHKLATFREGLAVQESIEAMLRPR